MLLAGSFGTFINPESARVIGLVPPVPVDRIVAAGNAAGDGARIALQQIKYPFVISGFRGDAIFMYLPDAHYSAPQTVLESLERREVSVTPGAVVVGGGAVGVGAKSAGKGIAAALLMANLQANLRSQCAIALDQPEQFLRSVNQLFFENTTDGAYATLFFAEYDDRGGRLRYANCGHLCALLLRSDDSVERLDSTSTVLGLFKEWDCSIGERQLRTGDTLALYTDGITESFNDEEEEYGEQRLTEALRRHRDLSSQRMISSIVDDVQKFSPREQHDDITLIVAKVRGD